MSSFWNLKVIVFCAELICGIALISYISFEKVKERSLVDHANAVRAQAERGDTGAETELGHLYHRGLGVPLDDSQAATWIRKAAEMDDSKAQYALGYLYWYGQGVPKDWTLAVKWYREAAEQGDARAECALASSYYYGQGLQQDRAAAAGWYLKAADQGFAEAQYALGYMLYYGQGIAQDRLEANRLFHLAADQGNENARRTLRPKRRSLGIWNVVQLVLSFGGGLLLLAGSFSHLQGARSLDRRTTALAGTFTLAFGGLDLLTYFNTLVVPYSSAETTLLSARDLIGGVSVAMLFTVVLTRKSAKVVMIISCGLFVAFNLFLLALYIRFHRVPTVRIFLMGDGWFLGVGVTSAILTWLERRKRGENGDTGRGLIAPESNGGFESNSH
jgi:hypothetical protein